MKIVRVVCGDNLENCYVIFTKDLKESFVIDPGEEVEEIFKLINDKRTLLKGILVTHGHFDHTGGIKFVQERTNCDVYINEKDVEYMKSESFIFGKCNFDKIKYIKEGEKIDFDDDYIEAIETPGHSPGGLCFKFKNKIFTGDTLFKESIGRTDFVGGNISEIIESIKKKLFILSEDTKVYPGHGEETTIGHEKSSNFYLGI